MNGNLTSERVTDIFRACLPATELPDSESIQVDGIMMRVSFSQALLQGQRENIAEMLRELPEEFHRSGGGGWSFMNACLDKNGDQWTGMHTVMEQLFLLGLAAGYVGCLAPRDMWEILPGGMPYYLVDTEQ